MYRHPVYATREVEKTCYVYLPMMKDPTKVTTKVRRMVTDTKGKPVVEMERFLAGTLPVEFDAEGKPVRYNTEEVVRPKEQLVPVPKPARLDPKCPKGVYRALKRLARKGLLMNVGAAIEAHNRKEVRA
jgi:hypothetical protein